MTKHTNTFPVTSALGLEELYVAVGVDPANTDLLSVFEENGEGVYCMREGSRGEVEDVCFVGKGPDFEYTDYADNDDDDDDDDEDEDEDEDGDDQNEFQWCEWEDDKFICSEFEEGADAYIYFAPSVKAAYDAADTEATLA
jgi:hypothetical protein